MQTDTICGFNAVAALFRQRPADVLRLFYGEAHRADSSAAPPGPAAPARR